MACLKLQSSILMQTLAPGSKSMRAGVLKSKSCAASFRSDKWSHLRATGIGCKGRSLVTFFSTYVSTPTFSASSSTPDTWNHMEPLVRVLVSHPATPFTLVFFLLCGRHRCWASLSCTNKAEDPGWIRALAIVLDPSAVVTFTLKLISSTCSLTFRTAMWVSFLPYSFSGFFCDRSLASLCSNMLCAFLAYWWCSTFLCHEPFS